MRALWQGAILGLCVAAAGCQSSVVGQDAVFDDVRRAATANGAELPAGGLRMIVHVLGVGAVPEGTWLEVARPERRGESMLLVYGTAADASLAARLAGREIEMAFTVLARVTLSNGRKALRIDVSSIRGIVSSDGR